MCDSNLRGWEKENEVSWPEASPQELNLRTERSSIFSSSGLWSKGEYRMEKRRESLNYFKAEEDLVFPLDLLNGHSPVSLHFHDCASLTPIRYSLKASCRLLSVF